MSGPHRFGHVEVRPAERELSIGGERTEVGARAFDLLLALIARQGRVATKDELIEAVWPGIVVEENTLAAQVMSLRKVLGARSVTTVPGRGYQLTLPAQAGVVPAQRAEPIESRARSNLPVMRDTLVGRGPEVLEITGLLREWRLVQVLGPGGIGKTRLAHEVATGSLAYFPDGAWWVDLAAVGSAERIAYAIASSTDVRLTDQQGIVDLARALAPRRMLVLLDSCEHLAADVAFAVNSLLQAAPHVRILLTSQELVRAQHLGAYRVEALAIPPGGMPLEEARAFGAIELLEKRARAVDARFSLSAETVSDAIALCGRLDGIPLALEMAASRLPVMGVRVLADHLDRHFGILRNASAHAVERQRTLQATLEWSHSLLSDEERRVLRYLSAFAGAFRLGVAERIMQAMGLDELLALDAITALVDKSLVHVEPSEPPRYRLLETTRRFARDELAIRGERDDAWRLHGEAMAHLAEEAGALYWEMNVRHWMSAYLPDYPDLQEAFDRAFERRDADVLASAGHALRRLDFERDMESESRRRKAAAMALLPAASPRARAELLASLLMFRFTVPAGMNRVDVARESVAAWEGLGDRFQHCFAVLLLALHLAAAGRADEAAKAFEQGRSLRDPQWSPARLHRIAVAEARAALYLRDEAAVRSACDAIDKLGPWEADPRIDTDADYLRGRLMLVAGSDDAAPILATVAERNRRTDRPRLLSYALGTLCSAYVKAGDLEHARAAITEALPLAWQMRATVAVDHLALFASSTGHHAGSAQLLGFNDAMYEQAQDRRDWPEEWAADKAHALNEAALGADEARRCRAEGAALDRAAAARLAYGLLSLQ
jgi:predicted ATPase/DNA-binding winged helix-turn-helix (wHTH) protein